MKKKTPAVRAPRAAAARPPNTANDAIVFDTETTGLPLPNVADLSAQPRIIELGAARVRQGKVIARYSQLINPGVPLPAEITKITGIKPEDLEGKPSFKECVDDLARIFRGAKYLIAHNAPFDKAILDFDLRRIGQQALFPLPPVTICSVQEFSHLAGKRIRLIELYKLATGKEYPQTHRALDDVNALYEALTALKFWDTLVP